MSNYLQVGDLIAEKLKQDVPAFKDVLNAADAAQIQEKTLRNPSCFVVYDGDEPAENVAQASVVTLKQRWMVVIATHHAQGKEKTRNEAGELMALVMKSLGGWQPAPAFKHLARVSTPSPGFSASYGYYPLMFETSTSIITDNSCN